MGRRDWSDYLGKPHRAVCAHQNVISTITAGMERAVCESCGHVSIRFVSETVKIFPDIEDLTIDLPGRRAMRSEEVRRPPRCTRCEAPAVFIIPRGPACAEHAWAAASRQDAAGGDIWIPIRIDQNAPTAG